MPTKVLFYIIVLFFVFPLCGQDERKISTVEIVGDITIDGVMDEAQWANTETSSEFTQNRPNPGDKASFKTEVRVLYDQNALYVGMEMFDPSPDSILHQLSERDEIGNTSWAGVIIGGFQDGINAFEYFVTVEGVQFDASVTTFGEDSGWNSVWTSATQITDKGWILEMKIPYSAMRFPENAIQQWDINFCRTIRRKREQSFWHHIDPEVNGFINQMGVINGIQNIKPSTRLFFYPYAGLNYDVSKDEDGVVTSGETFTAGMDLKYGLNNSFTLDATLVPDFGQVVNDDNVLNLSAFEVRFNENRQFFTEGTELFGKGDLFYSRRIGSTPVNIDKVYDKEDDGFTVIANPTKTKLLNAIKLSGRNKKGLGVGVFNAITNTSTAEIEDSLGNRYEIETAPLSNYNVIVLDQNLKNNSYISLINTNVLRNGNVYDANVIGTVFDIRDKDNKYSVEGGFGYSHKFNFDNDDENEGNTYSLGVAKISGNMNYGINFEQISPYFDSNDLGFLNNANKKYAEIWMNYNEYKPTKYFNNYWGYTELSLNMLSDDNAFSSLSYFVEFGANTKKFHAFGLGVNVIPIDQNDYFETRDITRYFNKPGSVDMFTWISSDYRKRFALDGDIGYQPYFNDDWKEFGYSLGPRFRVNDHLLITYRYNHSVRSNNQGYADTDDEIIFSKRDINTRINLFSGQYVFNNKMGLTFRVRHYWSVVDVHDFYELSQEGELVSTEFEGFEEDGSSDYNQNFNAITNDLGFRWVFSPGSELSLVWKTTISDFNHNLPKSFSENFDQALGYPSLNSFSIKILYFIDYLSLKKNA